MPDSLTEQYRMMHRQGFFQGTSTAKWLSHLTGLAVKHRPATVLDYGSGKGLQWSRDKLHEQIGIPQPVCYDPGVEEFSNREVLRQYYDLVICTDVMEHLENGGLFLAFKDVVTLADKAAFVAITCRPAKKTLPDGRNAHLSIFPPIWWRGYAEAVRFSEFGNAKLDLKMEFEE